MKIIFNSSPAIAIGIECNADYILLDDAAVRREAQRLGLTVRGTLAVIHKLHVEQKFPIKDLEALYLNLIKIGFRVRRSLFDRIFEDLA
jgi:predicted nucleic acid-binding protein